NENQHTERYLKRLGLAENIFGQGGSIVANVLSLLTVSYNQPQELESDRAGVYLAYMAGYDPERGLDFFRRIQEADQGQEKSNLSRFLSSHPFPQEREACLKTYLDASRVQ
ncbi:MAG: M48 family metalloprotease, partial [Bacteroidota bacterium]